ncbi:uncharacterized protein [Spinacia oleracea]|uniref:SWIM-type domain-containing protein n=1 Tax=Spinacia oleracea TaxID=3562 RepID=A0A9R0JJX2_SPIOL|nr:uncharacterized protein LOC110776833 [Spinacia oleracea]
MQKSATHEVRSFDHDKGLFQVTTGRGNRPPGKGGKKHNVDLVQKTCTCEKLVIYKLPCSHVLAVCRDRNLSYASFIDSYFSTREYRRTYIKSFKPLADDAYWSPVVGPRIIADKSKKRDKVGRPVSTRINNEMDEGARTKNKTAYSICRQIGHNARTCPSKSSVRSSGSHGAVDQT